MEMGVSFKVARAGSRYRPKLVQIEDDDNENGLVSDLQQRVNEGFARIGDKVTDHTDVLAKSGLHSSSKDLEVSFTVNLFPNGFSVGIASELFNDVPKQLHPYNRASERLFNAIEYGWLPGDFFDDIPYKYFNGALLCEIRDYRNCVSQRAGAVSIVNFPVIHKLVLHMCMENVVKDIVSMSNDSWTYKDLLEVESRILKALQPDLHLNLEPLLEGFSGKSLTKKIDLGINWSWKKRKLSDSSNASPGFSNTHLVTHVTGIGDIQSYRMQPDLTYREGKAPCLQQTISSSIPNLQENNVALDTMLQSNPLTLEPSYQLERSFNRSDKTVLTSSNIRRQCSSSNCNTDLRKSDSSVYAESSKCEIIQAVQRPVLKKLKQEPADFSQQLLLGNQAGVMLATDLQWKNNLIHQRIEAKKVLHERCHGKRSPFQFLNNGQQAILEGMPEIQVGMLASMLKQEPAETSNLPSSNVKKIKDNHFVIDTRRNQSNPQQLQLQQSLQLSRDNVSLIDMQRNHTVDPAEKNLRDTVTQKSKALQNPLVKAGVNIASVRFNQNESLPWETFVPAKLKNNYLSKDLSMKIIDSLAGSGTSNVNAIAASKPLWGNLPLNPTSEFKVDSFLDRFLKIQGVTQRYGLNRSKHKLDQFLPRKSFFHTTPLVALHLLNSRENGKLSDVVTDRISLSECFVDRMHNVSKTRALTFVCLSHHPGNEIPIADLGSQIKLIMSEKLIDGMVEASILYGHEEKIDSIRFPILPNFSTTHFADLFAAQFSSLMVREGYYLASDHIESTPVNGDGCSSSQHPYFSDSATPAAGAPKLPASSLTSWLPSSMLTSMTGRISSIELRHLLPSRNTQPAIQVTESNFSKSLLHIAAQVSPIQPHWQQILDKHDHLQFQMMERKRDQEQLMQWKTIVGGSGATVHGLGKLQLGGGIQGLGNTGFGSFGNSMGMGGSMQVPRGEQIPWMDNADQFNNPGGNISRANEIKQLLGVTSDHPAVLLAKLRTVEGQRNIDPVPMLTPNIQDMTYLLSSQQQSQSMVQQQLQQDMRSPCHPPEVMRLSEQLLAHKNLFNSLKKPQSN